MDQFAQVAHISLLPFLMHCILQFFLICNDMISHSTLHFSNQILNRIQIRRIRRKIKHTDAMVKEPASHDGSCVIARIIVQKMPGSRKMEETVS